ncbi:MAG: CP12 domain-containing protein [Chroococcales cyanobacterium]
MKAADIMTTEVVTIKGSATVAKAIQLMKDKGLRSLIVDRRTDNDAYGILTETDIVYKVIAYGKNAKEVRVYEIMTKPCVVVNPNLDVEYVARMFSNLGIRRAPVISGELQGIISITDIMKNYGLQEKTVTSRLEDEVQKAILEARELCEKEGATSKACIVAWDTVEELQAELAHRRDQKLHKTAFDEYCEEHPEADEARMYEV